MFIKALMEMEEQQVDAVSVLGVNYNAMTREYKKVGLLDSRILFHLTYNTLDRSINIENIATSKRIITMGTGTRCLRD